jgi:Rrf2 family protein
MTSLSNSAEYTLRAMVWLAGTTDEVQTTQQIADGTHVPPAYLSKVLQALSRANLVRSQRGLRGGFALAQSAEAIMALQIVEAVDRPHKAEGCPLGIPAHRGRLCALHRTVADALAKSRDALSQTSLTQLSRCERTATPFGRTRSKKRGK